MHLPDKAILKNKLRKLTELVLENEVIDEVGDCQAFQKMEHEERQLYIKNYKARA